MEKEGCFEFYTKYGVHYSIEFLRDDIMLSNEAYQLSIINVNHQSSPKDVSVRDTILSLINEFFRQNITTLLYICETGDGKQAMRNRLFNTWFSSESQKGNYIFMAAEIVDMEGITNYAAIIVPVIHPNLQSIIAEFTETVQLLSDKPQ